MSGPPDPDSLWQEQRGCLLAWIAGALVLLAVGALVLWFIGG